MLNLIIKPMCFHCKEKEISAFGLCDNCLSELKSINNKNRCKICGFVITGAGTICERCFRAKDSFDKAYFLFSFEDAGRTLVHNIKFKDKLHFLNVVEVFKNDQLNCLMEEVECITYIPSPYFTFAKRGYNVSFQIGESLSKMYNVPIVKLFSSNKLYKKRLSITKTKEERKKIINNFLKTKKCNKAFNKILIVDDVFTTGTTLNKASKLLKTSGTAKECFVFTLARVL